jgi:hypothetical protein
MGWDEKAESPMMRMRTATALRRSRPVLAQLVRRFRLRDNVERFFGDLCNARTMSQMVE